MVSHQYGFSDVPTQLNYPWKLCQIHTFETLFSTVYSLIMSKGCLLSKGFPTIYFCRVSDWYEFSDNLKGYSSCWKLLSIHCVGFFSRVSSVMINNCWVLEKLPTFNSVRLLMWILWWFKRKELLIQATLHSLQLQDFSLEELDLKTFPHYSTSSLWSFCPPSSDQYQSWHFFVGSSRADPSELFCFRVDIFVPNQYYWTAELLASSSRAVPLAPVGQLILIWKRESPQTPDPHSFPASHP